MQLGTRPRVAPRSGQVAPTVAETLSLRFGRSTKSWTPANAAENVTVHPDRYDMPLRWREPRIFVGSMSDLVHELVPDEVVARLWETMAKAPRHQFPESRSRRDPMAGLSAQYDRYWRSLRQVVASSAGMAPDDLPGGPAGGQGQASVETPAPDQAPPAEGGDTHAAAA